MSDNRPEQQHQYSGLPPVLVQFFQAFEAQQCTLEQLTQIITTCASAAGAAALRLQGHDIETLDDVALERCARVYAKLAALPVAMVRKRLKRLIEQEAEAASEREQQERLAAEPEWMHKLERDEHGRPTSCLPNAMLYLVNHEDVAGTLAYNEFTSDTVWLAPPKLGADFADAKPIERMSAVTDDEATLVQLWLKQHGQSHEHGSVQRLIDAAAKTRRFHPVRDYLRGLGWDGTQRVHNFLHAYLGATDNAYTRLVSRVWLVGAVARVMQPGCKLDTMTILEGDQGKGKSTAVRLLHGDAFFSDQLSDLGSKDSHADLRGRWVIEFAELDKFSKAEVSTVKRFLSILVDRYRPSYGRRTIEVPRQVIFIGTVNPDHDGAYLRDTTGNRRYLPVMTHKLDLEAIERDRDQLWAEACVLFASGAKWWPATDAEVALCQDVQGNRLTRDVWTDLVLQFVAVGRHATITTSHVLESALDVEPKDQTNYLQARVGTILRLAGWNPAEAHHKDEGHIRYFQHPDAVIPPDVTITRAGVNLLRLPDDVKPKPQPSATSNDLDDMLKDLQ